MSINMELRDQLAPGAVSAGLQQFGVLPMWLEAADQPERVQSALARSIPTFAAGELTLEACQCQPHLHRALNAALTRRCSSVPNL